MIKKLIFVLLSMLIVYGISAYGNIKENINLLTMG